MESIPQIRSFSRTVTHRIGVLDDHFLGRGRALGASRLLFEIGEHGVGGASIAYLRARLGLDSGYVSRLLRALEGEGLVDTIRDPVDRRARRAVLTVDGRRELSELNRRSDDAAASLLAPLQNGQRARLVAAMAEVERLFNASATAIERVDPASAEVSRCLEQYFAELVARFEAGFDPGSMSVNATEELKPPHGAFLVARLDGEPVACGAVRTWSPGVAELKRMWVAPELRGSGLGSRMLGALEREAAALGLGTVRLETNLALAEAQAMYRAHGYEAIEPFSGDPYADLGFERELGAEIG